MLSAGERRSLIETIFNIYVLALMLKEVKRRNTVNQTQQRLNLTTLTGLTEQRTTAEKFVNETEQIIERLLQQLDNQPKTSEARLLAKGADKLRAIAVLDANLPYERIVDNRHVNLDIRLFLQSAVCDFRVNAKVKSSCAPNAP